MKVTWGSSTASRLVPDPVRDWCIDRTDISCDALATPHNSNGSNGKIFDPAGLTKEGAELRAKMEPVGVTHIIGAADHLLLILALLLLLNDRRRLLCTLTAFTGGHSITLSLAATGLIRVPSAPTEAPIALSIVFLAAELTRVQRSTRETLAQRHPWLVAASFGLLHDPIVPLGGNNFTLKNSWITHSRDDAIKNDAFAVGVIEDNLISGFHHLYSCTNSGGLKKGKTPNCRAPGSSANEHVVIRNNLIALSKQNDERVSSAGFWKDWDEDPSQPEGTRSPRIDFIDWSAAAGALDPQ